MKSLVDLANAIGFEQIDQEIKVWIEMGEYDHAVQERAAVLGQTTSPGAELKQEIHRLLHKSGPYGWEFCSRCN